MAALVQTLPPQTTITMLSTGRPSSSGGYHRPQGAHSQSLRNSQMARYSHLPSSGYRGMPPSGPVAPYAFTSTPQLGHTTQTNTRQFTSGHTPRSPSAPTVLQGPTVMTHSAANPRQSSLSNLNSSNTLPTFEMDKQLSLPLNLPPSAPLLSMPSTNSAPKPSPDRYRRNIRRVDSGEGGTRVPSGTASPSGSGMAAVGQLYKHPGQSSSSPSLTSYQSYRGTTYSTTGQVPITSADDMHLIRSQNVDLAARYRRRSLGSIETAGLNHSGDAQDTSSPHPNAFIGPPSQPSNHAAVPRPSSSHTHTASSDSVSSTKSGRTSRPTSARHDPGPTVAAPNPAHTTVPPKQDPRLNVPARTTDSSRRNPSPLSRPVNIHAENEVEASPKAQRLPQSPITSSPATEQLNAINQKNAKKSKSKLRRAFSFGSAAELRKVTAQKNFEQTVVAQPAKRNSKYEDELEPEQARIAEKQEAAGLGESIYSGQGNFFTGSTDNLSISSTASSASIMLRKMGKGVKKGTRSLVGLFRPKSVVGVPAADGPVNEASAAQVSMVSVEAEREKVNVNLDPHDQAGGGTGFPKLERNSLDNKLSTDSGTASSETRSRRSIVGGEKERAEVLAAVKKGILKRADSNQPSPKLRSYDSRAPDFNLPQIPNINDSPRSSAPSTPADDTPRSGHRRTDSVTIEGNDHDDYFSSMTRFASFDSKTATPFTPQTMVRNISFSPRIQFHDTWPSGEYDRRGEIATCNRLTPMLAQQIKEELNTFKMEMEVHESSKVYTHFF